MTRLMRIPPRVAYWALLPGLCACAPQPSLRVPATIAATAEPRAEVPSEAKRLAIFWGSPADDPPEHRGGITPEHENGHYLHGNEEDLHVFQPAISGLGGGYVGVGSDQAYLFIEWARVELAWLVDYDPLVVDVHELHRLFFLHADDPEAYMDLWSISGRDAALELISRNHEGARALHLRELYTLQSASILARLELVSRAMQRVGVACYLTSQTSYDFVRVLIRQRRVRPMLVNLLDARGMKGVAESAKTLGVPINVLYLSNAEQYWAFYTKQYRANVAALPFGPDALLLRTLATGEKIVQAADNYLRWLTAPYIGNVYQMVERRGVGREAELIDVWGDPEDSAAGRRHHGVPLDDMSDPTPTEEYEDT